MVTKRIETIALTELFKKDIEGTLPILVEIYSPELVWGDDDENYEDGYLRLVSDNVAIKYKKNGEDKAKTYLPSCISYKPPAENGKEIGSATISISAIDYRVIQMIRSITVRPQVTVVASFMKEGSKFYFAELNSRTFENSSVSWNKTAAEFTLVYDNVMKLQVPRDKATAQRFPACYDNN